MFRSVGMLSTNITHEGPLTSNCPSLFQPPLISCSHFHTTHSCVCIRFPFFMPLAAHIRLIKLNNIPGHRMILQGDRLDSSDLFFCLLQSIKIKS